MDITVVPGFNPGPFTGAGNNTYVISGKFPTLLDAATGEAAHLTALAEALASKGRAARGESPAAFDRRCIPPGYVASRSNTAGMLPRRALPDGRITGLGATPDFHHGLLAQVLVTHAHPDHADGCGPVAERWPDAVFKKMPWPERDRLQAVECVPIRDGNRIAAGDGTLLAVHTPGHAPDHLCFFDETSGTLFSADLVVPGAPW